jgi:hypothetical protein
MVEGERGRPAPPRQATPLTIDATVKPGDDKRGSLKKGDEKVSICLVQLAPAALLIVAGAVVIIGCVIAVIVGFGTRRSGDRDRDRYERDDDRRDR